uniref:Gag-Pol polyprotein n=1 Tax=Tanacetum cinerariifolium TaxID=118510 RepID=A0A699IC36_TANCI|nr:hypothetical protein [Tanacetum cinerariifolium]
MQTQTSNTLHNAIMEAGSNDRPPMLAPGNYIQWKSRIKRYIDTKPSHELIHYCLTNFLYKLAWADKEVPISEGIDNDIYSTVGACPNACEMWKAIERFYKMMNELIRNQCDVTNHQVNVQFLLQLQLEWKRFVTLVKQSQELKTISYHKLYDILKQHQNEVNEIRAKRIACTANPLVLVAQQQPVYHPQNHPTRYTQNSSTRSQQAATRNRGKAIVNSSQPIYDQEPSMVAEDDETSKDKEIDKIMALISLSSAGYENQRIGNVAGAKETVEQADWRDDTDDDELEDLELEAHYIEEIDQNDDNNDLVNERELLASLIKKLKCKVDDNKNRNKFLETSNKVLVEKLKGAIEDFKNKNKSLESSNNCFKEANNKLSETNNLLYDDFKKSEAELAKRNSVEYASKMEIKCAQVRGDLISYKMESQKSFNKYTQTINDLNQTISEMKNKLCAQQETISILSQQKEAQIKLYKTREHKELDKVISLENKVKVLDNIVYKTGQSVQTINMLNNKCRTSFAKPKFLKKAQRANPRLHDIGCYNNNLALKLAPKFDEVIRLEKESRSKLSDLIRPFDYDKLNNLYDLFVPQREKSSEKDIFQKDQD